MQSDKLTIYHDGTCALCRKEIDFYRRQLGAERLAFVDAADPVEQALGRGLTKPAAMARFHVRLPDGRLISGAAGFAAVWAQLPRFHWAASLARCPGVMPVLDFTYRLFLPLRPHIAGILMRFGRN